MATKQAIAAEPIASPGKYELSFVVQLTDEAVYAYSEIPSQNVYTRIGMLLDFIATHPYYGLEYDPYYEAACLSIACRVFYCGKYGVYYHVDESNELITILAIDDQRRNPLNRFRIVDGN